jgi:myo-inositol 2-dehydrogenase/D-chiro-inositol 1-dehydrogenase
MNSRSRRIGLAVVGAGKIGRHRARLAAQHAGVSHLAIADIDPQAAERLAAEVGADTWSTDVDAVVGSADVDAIVVSTNEEAHTEPLLSAVRTGKPTLVEKPLTLTLTDADRVIAAAREHGVDLRVGYSMRYAQRYAVAHEQMANKRIGQIIGGTARAYDTVAIGEAILARSPSATAVKDVLTYFVDLIGWCHPQARPAQVVARANGMIMRSRGHDVEDLTFALLTYDDGSVFDLATSYSLPEGYPSSGMAARFELIGTEGVLLIDEDHRDQILYSEAGYDNEYVDQRWNLAFLGSRTSGEWAGGTMFGRVADETRAWLDHLTVGGPCHITTAAEARTTLAVTQAIDEAAATGRVVEIELPE